MLTTDTVHKTAGAVRECRRANLQITGMAKGAAMMGPNMATMLALIMTDAPLDPDDRPDRAQAAADESFNCMSVDGHMSTNDTVLLLANGAAGGEPLAGADLATFRATLDEVCVDLAKAIAGDGEGATHLVTIEISGCADRADGLGDRQDRGQQPAGEDGHPRRRSELGPHRLGGRLCRRAVRSQGRHAAAERLLALRDGAPVEFDAATVSKSIRDNRDTLIQLDFREGTAGVRFWTADLTAEYVRLNADYHT